MAQLMRIGRTRAVPGVGYARRGVIHTVPDELVDEFLAGGEWAVVAKPANLEINGELIERVTEPAPSEPATKTPTKRPAKRR